MHRLWVKYDGTKSRLDKLATLGNAVFARRGVKYNYYIEEIECSGGSQPQQ